MQLRNLISTFLAALLISTAAPLIYRSMRVLEAHRLLLKGNKQLNISQFKGALNSYQQALKIYQSIGERRWEANSLGDLGVVYDSLG